MHTRAARLTKSVGLRELERCKNEDEKQCVVQLEHCRNWCCAMRKRALRVQLSDGVLFRLARHTSNEYLLSPCQWQRCISTAHLSVTVRITQQKHATFLQCSHNKRGPCVCVCDTCVLFTYACRFKSPIRRIKRH